MAEHDEFFRICGPWLGKPGFPGFGSGAREAKGRELGASAANIPGGGGPPNLGGGLPNLGGGPPNLRGGPPPNLGGGGPPRPGGRGLNKRGMAPKLMPMPPKP